MVWMYFYLVILILSAMLTWALRRYALTINLLDIPNHRSSHSVPTPRGGGIAFVFCFLLALSGLAWLQIISLSLFAVLGGVGLFIAVLGFLDDNYNIAAKWRLLGHFIACGFSVFLLGGMPDISFFSWTLSSSLVSDILAVFYLVWLLNLYNFMDGIDGIAAIEAVTVCLNGALLYWFHSYQFAMFLPCVLAVAVAGFLFWNFPPARIFMGDAGSGFLGFILGVLSIQAAMINSHFFWSWMILLGVFIVDATVTLLNRARCGERLFEAHCNHAYQHASRYYGQHITVTLSVFIINLLWLLPMAFMVSNNLINGFFGLLIAYFPLIILALKFNAGKNINGS
ncbi:MAG: glycosyltransferase family 4 protein [Legionella sp.]|nr:glycosyltransferase family 4 protein [Legionella sp.]